MISSELLYLYWWLLGMNKDTIYQIRKRNEKAITESQEHWWFWGCSDSRYRQYSTRRMKKIIG